ncbi:MAG TPA: segregation/condensation protein A [Polyangiaceae bacterium]|jgi:segregation and condensation protein A|nr:segregation/condensation protein A [Polyangiaceae bacterium]
MGDGEEHRPPLAPGAAEPDGAEGPGIAKTRISEVVPRDAAPVTGAEGTSGGYRVALPTFEGPLDLLLHLIQKHELDILDIPIGFVTEKYVEYILMMEQVNIDIASEYLVMAATLAHIKSKMLLPTPPADQDEAEEEQEDPRAELVRRLLEYQKYRLAAEQLGGRSVLGRDVFVRGTGETVDEGPAPLASLSLFKLMDAFESILKRVQQHEGHQIDFERISITDRINQLSDILRERPSLAFDQLFSTDHTRADVIVTFLALLEMTRLKMTRITQESAYAPIYIELAVREDVEGPAVPSEGELE